MNPDALDLQRLGLLTLAVVDLAQDAEIRIRRTRRGVYRVDVLHSSLHHTAHAPVLWDAMDGACDWLRRMSLPLGAASALMRRRMAGLRT